MASPGKYGSGDGDSADAPGELAAGYGEAVSAGDSGILGASYMLVLCGVATGDAYVGEGYGAAYGGTVEMYVGSSAETEAYAAYVIASE